MSRIWACEACNNMKGDMTPPQWRKFMADNPQWWKLWRRGRALTLRPIVSGDIVRELARKIISGEYDE